jgi:hypothetical protein
MWLPVRRSKCDNPKMQRNLHSKEPQIALPEADIGRFQLRVFFHRVQ